MQMRRKTFPKSDTIERMHLGISVLVVNSLKEGNRHPTIGLRPKRGNCPFSRKKQAIGVLQTGRFWLGATPEAPTGEAPPPTT